MKNIVLLGSTGSIGRSTLDVVRRHSDRFRIIGLAARSSVDVIEEQIRLFKPKIVAMFNEEAAETLIKRNTGVEVLSGERGVIDIATMDEADVVVSAIVGSSALVPTYEAIRCGKHIALANKESIVMAGPIIMSEAKKRGVKILPVDSEHSAIFQCLECGRREDVRRLILTASGGPFLKNTIHELKHVTPKEALKHPNWSMGPKITIDSSTLMNKALEVIEAKWLFDMPEDKIDVFLHPQSIVHSMVEYIDGSIIAQMSKPDMRGPICYALSYPERLDDVIQPLSLEEMANLCFKKPDLEKYPCLSLAYRALSDGGTMPSVMNAANEVAVEAFLNGKIQFLDIYRVVKLTMDAHDVHNFNNIEEVIEAANWAKTWAEKIVEGGLNSDY
ncbi:MAG: 1-deoxy-D-xylulose-5-phosphate reductoisomerase [Nitrospirae bacterium]|nr:MAG: 1-deoxy-D-xylulose-5-phosphate reductoisomerase [Nitrospirota bacterium]